MNNNIITEFEKLIEQEQYKLDNLEKPTISSNIRLSKLKNSLDIIKKYKKKIKQGEELDHIPGIGKGTIRRINEILDKGYLSEIKKNKADKYMKIIVELEKVFGIGRRVAYDLIKKYDVKSVKDLQDKYKKGKIELPRHIILGLKYYKEHEDVIPRAQIKQIDKYLQDMVKKIDKDLCIVICGSYRREKDYSKDIDILLTHKDVKTKAQMTKNNYLLKVVDKLKKEKFIIDDIDINYKVKYMGFIKYKNNPIRHLDILYIPYNSFAASLLHFTGPWELNKKMRSIAIMKGYKLNQYGLYDKKTKKLIKTPTEKDIFEKLGMEYLEPKYRV